MRKLVNWITSFNPNEDKGRQKCQKACADVQESLGHLSACSGSKENNPAPRDLGILVNDVLNVSNRIVESKNHRITES